MVKHRVVLIYKEIGEFPCLELNLKYLSRVSGFIECCCNVAARANKSKMHLDLGSLILHLIQLQLNIKLHSCVLSDLQQLKLANL